MTQDKSMHMNYLDLDIICDGLFILSCLGELDVHRKVREGSIFSDVFCFLFPGDFWFGRY
jgi:hypothetical protein